MATDGASDGRQSADRSQFGQRNRGRTASKIVQQIVNVVRVVVSSSEMPIAVRHQ